MDIVLYTPRESQIFYPDKWTGPAAYKSNIYPDNWNGPAAYTDYLYPDRYRPPRSRKARLTSSLSTLALRPRPHNTMCAHAFDEEAFHARIKAIRDRDELEGFPGPRYKESLNNTHEVRTSSFSSTSIVQPRASNTMDAHAFNEEAFNARLRALRDRGEMEDIPSTSNSETFDTTPKFSGANEIPLGKIRRPRSPVLEPHQTRSTSKRSQLAPAWSLPKTGKQTLIDLTSDDDDTPIHPVRPTTTPRLDLQPTTTIRASSPSAMDLSHTPPPPLQKDPAHTLAIRPANIPSPTFPSTDIKLENPHTVRVFTKAANKLRQSQESVQRDKRALSRCWEMDAGMQTGEVMERLRALNEYYRVVEEGLEGALGVLEGLV